MTTKFLDNFQNLHFQNFIVEKFPTKQAFLDNFPPCPQGPPPLKSENFIFIVVSPALNGPAIRNANQGDSRESTRRKKILDGGIPVL